MKLNMSVLVKSKALFIKSFFSIIYSWILFGCGESTNSVLLEMENIEPIATPCQTGGEPNLFVSEEGEIYLSWIEYLNDSTDALLFSTLEQMQWSTPKTIAKGNDWFTNWADFPSFVAYQNNTQHLAAHWLQKSGAGTYDYDVRISQSLDGGKHWQPSFVPYQDSVPSEHGFVSMLPVSADKVFITWLDGRNTKNKSNQQGTNGHRGAMTLRAAFFDQQAQLYEEAELDNRVCDCCQTAATLTDKGVVVAYRDRSEEEIRDIYVTRNVGEEWIKPKPVFKDNWKISGCPVNGAALDAKEETVALAWYSAPENKAQVKLSFSKNSGADFDAPIVLSNVNPIGRVDVILLSENTALVSWIEKEETGAVVKIAKINAEGTVEEQMDLTTIDAARQSGFPIMKSNGEIVIFAWTEVGEATVVKTAWLKI